MGDFTTVDQVKSLFRRIKIEPDTGDEKTNTVLTTEEVEQFISEAETFIKSRLAPCYVVDPISNIGVDSLTMLGTVAKYKVAQVIKNIMELTTNNSDRKFQDMTADWGKMAHELIDKICPEQECGKSCKLKPTLPLPDTPQIAEPPTGASLFNSPTNTKEFTKSGPNW